MKKLNIILLILIAFPILFSGCNTDSIATPTELYVSAAASLKAPLDEIIQSLKAEKGIIVNVNYGSSGTLQKQIEEGAPVDVFISAGKRQVDSLIEKGLGDKGSYKELLGNSLVLIVSNSYDKNIRGLEDLKDKNIKLALGEVGTVPVGQYSKEYMENVNLWTTFEGKIVYAKDVKSVLSYVEAGDAQAGIVYHSDTFGLKNSYIAERISTELHKPIVYPLVKISASKNDASDIFIDYLTSDKARAIFEKYNFEVK